MNIGNEPSAATKFFNDAAACLEKGDRADALEYLELVEFALPRDPFKTGFDVEAYRVMCEQLSYDSAYYGWTFPQHQAA